MEQLQVTQFSGEELQKQFEGLKNQLDDIKRNFQPKIPNKYLTRKDVAEMFKIDISTVHNWTRSGKLKSYSIGNRVFYILSELEDGLITINDSLK